MDLVEDHQRRVQALLGVRLCRQAPVHAADVGVLDGVPVQLHHVGKLGLKLHHALRHPEHDPGLVAVPGARVHLGTRLPSGEQPPQGDPGPDGGLAVLAGQADQATAVAAQPIGPLLEQVDQQLLLPLPQVDQLAGAPTLRDPAQATDEVDDALGVTARRRLGCAGSRQASTSLSLRPGRDGNGHRG